MLIQSPKSTSFVISADMSIPRSFISQPLKKNSHFCILSFKLHDVVHLSQGQMLLIDAYITCFLMCHHPEVAHKCQTED